MVEPRRNAFPTAVTAPLLVILCCGEILVVTSDLGSGVRFGLGALFAVLIVLGAYQLGRNRRAG